MVKTDNSEGVRYGVSLYGFSLLMSVLPSEDTLVKINKGEGVLYGPPAKCTLVRGYLTDPRQNAPIGRGYVTGSPLDASGRNRDREKPKVAADTITPGPATRSHLFLPAAIRQELTARK